MIRYTIRFLKNCEFLCQKNLFLSHFQIRKLLSKKFFFLELLVFEKSWILHRFLIFFTCLYIFAGCTSQVVSPEKIQEKSWTGVQVAIIPHHMLTRSKVDEFYQLLQREYPHPDRIVILSPNHFNYGSTSIESIESPQIICFRGTCTYGIPYPGYKFLPSSFPLFMSGNTGEHGLGEHFGFINTYFPKV